MNKFNYLVLAICLVIVWGGLMVFIYFKSMNNPCSVCAAKFDQPIVFSITGQSNGEYITMIRTYYPNKSSTTSILDYEINMSSIIGGKV